MEASLGYTPASELESYDYPSPQSVESEQPETEKKKRKQWGQPVPNYKIILPPRKRAKTAEEKEQRKHERVLRNRRAADKSRQRQKAAYADMEVENAALKDALAQYQMRFGDLPGVSIPSVQSVEQEPRSSTPPQFPPNEAYHQSPATTSDSASNRPSPEPTLLYQHPDRSQHHQRNMSLTEPLFPPQEQTTHPFDQVLEPLMSLSNSNDVSDLTQYPAAILCDLQCQSQTSKDLEQQARASQVFRLFLLTLTTLMNNFTQLSISTQSTSCQMLRSLVKSLSTTSIDLEFLVNHFQLIRTLISTTTSTTSHPIFRMKLLSRLLACSPNLARLLQEATDEALQRAVSEDALLESKEAGNEWASLMSLKWSIHCLEREHQRYRLVVDKSCDESLPGLAREMGVNKMDGVDYEALERSTWRWRSDNIDQNTKEPACLASHAVC